MLSAQSVALETRFASTAAVRLSKEMKFYWSSYATPHSPDIGGAV
jgi:hypothetical protein